MSDRSAAWSTRRSAARGATMRLELLGDLAFQDGRFGEALAMYSRLVADRPDDPFVLVHPDPSVDLARVAAKKLLCRAAEGENPPGQADLDEFARRYPGATGSLAGRNGAYAQILAESLASDHLAPPSQPDSRWPTFAGSLAATRRSSRARSTWARCSGGSSSRRSRLSRHDRLRPAAAWASGRPPAPPERLLAFHPIVLGDQVIVCDGTRVLAYNLNDRPADAEGTCAAAGRARPGNIPPRMAARFRRRGSCTSGIPRYTLTAVGHRIYARMGAMSPAVFPGCGMGGRGIELDRGPRLEHAGQVALGAEVDVARLCPIGRPIATATIGRSASRGRRSPMRATSTSR